MKINRLTILILLTITLSIMILTVGGCAPDDEVDEVVAEDDEIRVGVVLPLTGIFATIGDEVRRGHDLAVDLINQEGGVLGKQVRLIYEDDEGEPSNTMERARKLVEEDNVHVLVGTVSSATTLAAIPVAEELGVPFIYGMEGELKTTKIGNPDQVSDWVIGCGTTPEQVWIAALDAILEYGNTFYFIGSDYVYPRSFNAAGITRLEERGAEIIEEEYIPLGTTDYAALITKIQGMANEFEVLWSTLVGTDAVAFAKQANEFGLFDDVAVLGMAQYAPGIFPGMVEDVEGQHLFNLYSEEIDNPENEQFLELYREKFDPEHPIAAETVVNGWTTQMLLRAGYEKAGSTDGADLIQALKGLEVDVPQGTVRVNPDNHIVEMPIFHLKIEDGRYRIIEELGTVEHPGFEGTSVD